jgi:hypothetical protein
MTAAAPARLPCPIVRPNVLIRFNPYSPIKLKSRIRRNAASKPKWIETINFPRTSHGLNWQYDKTKGGKRRAGLLCRTAPHRILRHSENCAIMISRFDPSSLDMK